MTNKILLLVDADLLLYKAGFSSQVELPFNTVVPLYNTNLQHGINYVHNYIDKCVDLISKHLGTELNIEEHFNINMCLSSDINFRKVLNPEYKANRKLLGKPIIYNELKTYIMNNFTYKINKNIEADDTIGLLYNKYRHDDTMIPFICSEDKDFFTIKDHRIVSVKHKCVFEGNLGLNKNIPLYSQIISGDVADNYKGVYGYGNKRAKKLISEYYETNLLATEFDIWNDCIVPTYIKHGLTIKEALLNARMAYILQQEEDYDYTTKKIRLWKPKKTTT